MKKNIIALTILSGLSFMSVSQADTIGYYQLKNSGVQKVQEVTGNQEFVKVVVKKDDGFTVEDYEYLFENIYYETGLFVKYRRDIGKNYMSLQINSPYSNLSDIKYALRYYDLSKTMEPDSLVERQTIDDEPYYIDQLYMLAQSDYIGANNLRDLIDKTTAMPQNQPVSDLDPVINERVTVAILDTGYLIHDDMSGLNIVDEYKFSTVFEDNEHYLSDARGTQDVDFSDLNDSTTGRGNSAQDLRNYLAVYIDPDEDPSTDDDYFTPIDNCFSGHGLAVSSVLSAPINNRGLAGAANVNLVFAKVLDSDCRDVGGFIDPSNPSSAMGRETLGLLSDVADAILWASGEDMGEARTVNKKADIINISLGTSMASSIGCPNYLQDAIDQAINNGSIIVTSSGNTSLDSASVTPGNCSGVINVTSNDINGNKSTFSTANAPYVAFSMLGENLPIAVGNGTNIKNEYIYASGTSISAGVFSGVASLLRYSFPTIDWKITKDVVSKTSTEHPDVSNCFQGNCGAGIVDAGAAYDYLQAKVDYVRDSDYYFDQNLSCNDRVKFDALNNYFNSCDLYTISVSNLNEVEGGYYKVMRKNSNETHWAYNSRNNQNNVEYLRSEFMVDADNLNQEKVVYVGEVSGGYDYAIMYCDDGDVCHPPIVLDFTLTLAERPAICQ